MIIITLIIRLFELIFRWETLWEFLIGFFGGILVIIFSIDNIHSLQEILGPNESASWWMVKISACLGGILVCIEIMFVQLNRIRNLRRYKKNPSKYPSKKIGMCYDAKAGKIRETEEPDLDI
jgi:hypothetical protein